MVTPDTWIMSNKNRPFDPFSLLTASELVSKPPEELRTVLRTGLPRNGSYDENLERDFFHIRLGNLQFMKHPQLSKLTSRKF